VRLRVAVAGKGGAGKSVLAGTLARVLAGRGYQVLALDSDLMPGLALSLGAADPDEPPLNEAAEQGEDGRWRLRRGIGPVRAVQRFATPAPGGVRLLQSGKISPTGLGPIMGALQAFYRVVHGIAGAQSLRGWSFVGDLPAGPRQTAFDWAPYAETVLLVAEPSWKSALTARRIARIARSRERRPTVLVVANKVRGAGDARRVERMVGEPVFASVQRDEAVFAAERAGRALIDHAPRCAAARGIERLAEELSRYRGDQEVTA
jgi:CO dehydrogenase maturation factor